MLAMPPWTKATERLMRNVNTRAMAISAYSDEMATPLTTAGARMLLWNWSARTISPCPSCQPPPHRGEPCVGVPVPPGPRPARAPWLLFGVVADVRLARLGDEHLVASGVRAVVLHHVLAPHGVLVAG